MFFQPGPSDSNGLGNSVSENTIQDSFQVYRNHKLYLSMQRNEDEGQVYYI